MAVTTTVDRVRYNGNGTTTTFAYPFRILNNTDIVVSVGGVVKTLTTDYTLTGVGNVNGGNVVFNTAPASGTNNVFFQRKTTIDQQTDYTEGGKFAADTVETDFDKGIMIDQEINALVNASTGSLVVKAPDNHTATTWSGVLPDPGLAANQNKVLRQTATGIDLVSVQTTDFANPLTTKGDVVAHDGTSAVRVPVGSNSHLLAADSTSSSGIGYIHVPTVMGNVELIDVSTTSIKLQAGVVPVKTNGIWRMRVLASDITLSNAGLTADTNYYIYLFDNAGTLTLEASTTGHAKDSDFGVEVKSGDPTRTLVGLTRTTATAEFGKRNPGFLTSPPAMRLLSWFNRKLISGNSTNYTGSVVAASSMTEFNTAKRVEFLVWANESVSISSSGTSASSNTTGAGGHTGLFIDGVDQQLRIGGTSSTSGYQLPTTIGPITVLFSTEGFHNAGMGGLAFGGGSYTINTNAFITVQLLG